MEYIFDKKTLSAVLENIKVSKNQRIWIHHPITEDLIQVNVLNVTVNKILVSVPEESPYFGQPDWYIAKTSVVGIV